LIKYCDSIVGLSLKQEFSTRISQGIYNTFEVKVKFADIKRITCGENIKSWYIDSEVLKYGAQMGFVTPVVHTLTYGNRFRNVL